MFEDGSDAALIDKISAATRAESVAIAARLAAIGALDSLREQELAESILWRTDPFEEVAAEISAAMRIARGRAATQIHHARVLRDKLPLVAARFAVGDIDYRVVRMIIARTGIVDPSVWAGLDAELAARAHRWMRFSERQLRDRVDQWIAKLDPNGVRVPPDISEQRFVQIEPSTPGMASIWANIDAVEAVALNQRLDAVANTVCEQDPRSHEQRRADAVGPLARLEAQLVCRCGREDCPATQNRAAADAAVVHVLAGKSTVDGGSDAPGYLPGHGILPAESVRNVAAHAKIKPVRMPATTSEPAEPAEAAEPGYRPTAGLSEFIRWRDLTCRFPGCDAPAERCDVDHTAPWPLGPTHPSNTKLYCRAHRRFAEIHSNYEQHQSGRLPAAIDGPLRRGHGNSPSAQGLFGPV
ncbi:protein of uncharacterised function DUF222 [Mycolicibacterium fortuitum]|uniref:Protein of uncharacterized function DUF222 n=1 Tax=Mycolicibacterium fortuitum TaxID=1766 RepID=A0A378V0H4_MYCFO|nr:protein of uncharacterised function DUF222 [Mycolicibacterium fortuitum]